MKAIKKITKSLATAALLAGLAVNFNACTQQSPMAPQNNEVASVEHEQNPTLPATAESNWNNSSSWFSNFLENITKPSYPQSGSVTLKYNSEKGRYKGGYIYLSNGAFLRIRKGSFTPPPGTPEGEPVTVTMKVELDEESNELIYSFGPHGSTFSPEAKLTLAFADIETENSGSAALYYLDDAGNYTETFPDLLEMLDHIMLLEIPHFSRYAVAWSN